jgi:hypothetical protein
MRFAGTENLQTWLQSRWKALEQERAEALDEDSAECAAVPVVSLDPG